MENKTDKLQEEFDELTNQMRQLKERQIQLQIAMENIEQLNWQQKFKDLVGKYILDSEQDMCEDKQYYYIKNYNEQTQKLSGVTVCLFPNHRNVIDIFCCDASDLEHLCECQECTRTVFQQKFNQVLTEINDSLYTTRTVLIEKNNGKSDKTEEED